MDFLQKKMKQNEGEVQQYYIENSHEAIIPPEDWDLVQSEIEKRKNIGSRYSSTSVFASKLICGDCGSFYGHKTWHSTDKYRKTIWRCNAKFNNAHRCQTPTLTEDTIKFAFLKAYNKLIDDHETIIENCKLLLSQINTDEYADEMQRLRDELALISEQAKICITENANTAQSQTDYERKYSALTRKYEQTEYKLQRLMHETEQRTVRKTKLIAFINELRERGFVLDGWSEEAWITVVDTVKIERNGRMMFRFKDGREIIMPV